MMPANQYPFISTLTVAFRDLDAFGHVNNAVYLSYMEQARIDLTKLYIGEVTLNNIPWIVGSTTIRYLSPAYISERLLVGMGVSRFGNKSFDLAYQIDTEDGRAVATASTTIIYFDYTTQQSLRVPDAFRNQVKAIQGDWSI